MIHATPIQNKIIAIQIIPIIATAIASMIGIISIIGITMASRTIDIDQIKESP